MTMLVCFFMVLQLFRGKGNRITPLETKANLAWQETESSEAPWEATGLSEVTWV